MYLLYYNEDRIYSTVFPKGQIKTMPDYALEDNGEKYDYSLVENADVYIFSELEEYTYAIILLLAEAYPQKTILVLDKKISYFPELADCAVYAEPEHPGFESIYRKVYKKHCLWVISDMINYDGFPWGYLIEIYNSINVLYSMAWCRKRVRLGEKNKDCVIYLADFPGTKCGLVDYIRFTYIHYSIAKQHGWEFCVDYSRRPIST